MSELKIIIQDELTINNAVKIFKLLAEGLLSDGDLIISIPSPIPVDVSFMQIIHTLWEKCKAIDKNIYFEINGQNELANALKSMGYSAIAPVFETPERKMEGL